MVHGCQLKITGEFGPLDLDLYSWISFFIIPMNFQSKGVF